MIISTARAVSHAKTLLASAAQTATSTGETAVPLSDAPNGYVFMLDVTAAATAVGDTLNVFIQARIGNSTDGVWVDVAHFTELKGDGGAKRYFTKLTGAVNTAEFENGAALAAAAVRNIFGDTYRVRFVVVDADADDASFTFSVVAIPM